MVYTIEQFTGEFDTSCQECKGVFSTFEEAINFMAQNEDANDGVWLLKLWRSNNNSGFTTLISERTWEDGFWLTEEELNEKRRKDKIELCKKETKNVAPDVHTENSIFNWHRKGQVYTVKHEFYWWTIPETNKKGRVQIVYIPDFDMWGRFYGIGNTQEVVWFLAGYGALSLVK